MFYDKPLQGETVNETINETKNDDKKQNVVKQDVNTNINEIVHNDEKHKLNATLVNTSETINNTRSQQSRNSMNHSLIYTYNSGKKNIVKARKFNLTM